MNRKPKILLVDDDADFVKANRALLESDGFDVVTASSGTAALGKVRFDQPDLIVLDLMMESHDTGLPWPKRSKQTRCTRGFPY